MLVNPGLEVIKLENSLKLKIKHNDWLLVDTYPQAVNHCALFTIFSVAKPNSAMDLRRQNTDCYMSAHFLLNLLNEFGKRDKMLGLPSILSLFRIH